jgi:hypothetical protein
MGVFFNWWYTKVMETKKQFSKKETVLVSLGLFLLFAFFIAFNFRHEILDFSQASPVETNVQVVANVLKEGLQIPTLDYEAYDKKLLEIANNPNSTSTTPNLWPVKTAYPLSNPILPFNRVVAYYGNLYSRGMGILGEFSEDEVLRRLGAQVEKWNAADPTTPVVPALHYIAVVAQAGTGRDGMYRARMPEKEIDKVLAMAEKIQGIVFLDIQVGLSNVETEVPLLEKYLKLPNVHLGIDPEFSMKQGGRPGERIGTLDASDINFSAEYLAKIVKANNLTPKILVIHRFTQPMLTNYKKINALPEVQIVIDMDGFGAGGNKLNTYKQYVAKEPVQFTGFKLFYYNDTKGGRALLTPEDLLKLNPIPVYIQYQ